MTDEHVTFVRNKEREEMYIKFFSSLLDKLRNTDFSLRHINPGGTSWVSLQSGDYASFNFSFARGKQFRVELYIDTGDQARNKEVFDALYEQKQQIESEVGESISWQRLDTKRASRIAVYRDGYILDDDETLTALQDWAIPVMLKFEAALSPRLQNI